jgi:hypothetical protein
MHSAIADGDPRLLAWRRVREFAVPPSMIETATARRAVGDWAGACAAAHVDADVDLRALAGIHGRELAARVRADLRHLAPDLLRWHMPRVAPDGLLRPGLTVSLARYRRAEGEDIVQLVARTAPAWADAGQRISLAFWDGSRGGREAHPHPRPARRFRLDVHRHLWDARHAGELRERSGVESWPGRAPDRAGPVPEGCAVHRWAAEAELLRQADGRADDPVTVRVGARLRLVLNGDGAVPRILSSPAKAYPVLPDAATWVLPDLELLRAGLIDADRLHPLVAAALAPNGQPSGRLRAVAGRSDGPPADRPEVPDRAGATRLVECRGAQHRIGLVAGALAALDHDASELRREELLVALGGTPLACLRMIDEVSRNPEGIADIRARLDHGDTAGALAAVEDLLGPEAVLRGGALRDELETAAGRRVTYGLYRSGLAGRGPLKRLPDTRRRAGRPHARRSPIH